MQEGLKCFSPWAEMYSPCCESPLRCPLLGFGSREGPALCPLSPVQSLLVAIRALSLITSEIESVLCYPSPPVCGARLGVHLLPVSHPPVQELWWLRCMGGFLSLGRLIPINGLCVLVWDQAINTAWIWHLSNRTSLSPNRFTVSEWHGIIQPP